ncbi:hypothetical protein BLOT_012941 [Blomia tropicalis]|nr:hypothetical protein BLOT_012941 [Blomia tropicalis]
MEQPSSTTNPLEMVNVRSSCKCLCEICWKEFANMRSLLRHQRRFHNGAPGRSECDQCPLKFMTEAALERHRTMSHGKQSISYLIVMHQCYHCQEQFDSDIKFNRHIRTYHSTDPLSVYCERCKRYYANQQCYRTHVRSYHNDAQYECFQCDKKYHSRTVLRRHQKIHERIVQCTKCTQTFQTKFQLKRHERSNHVIGFACQKCNEQFQYQSQLAEHYLAVHPNDRNNPYANIYYIDHYEDIKSII